MDGCSSLFMRTVPTVSKRKNGDGVEREADPVAESCSASSLFNMLPIMRNSLVKRGLLSVYFYTNLVRWREL